MHSTKFYKINRAAKILNLTPRTLRFYENEGLLPPVRRTAGGMRLYSDKDLETIREIKSLQKENLPLFLIKQRLSEKRKAISSYKTKEKIRIVTDSASDIPFEISEKLGIEIIPLKINWRGKIYRDNIDLTWAEFADSKKENENPPEIIIPHVEKLVRFYQKLVNLGAEKIISIHSSSNFNSLILNAQKAAQKIKTAEIKIINSQSFSVGTGVFAIKGAEFLKAGFLFKEINEKLGDLTKKIHLFIIVDDLRFLLSYLPKEYQKNIFSKILDFKALLLLGRAGDEIKSIDISKEERNLLQKAIPKTKKERKLIENVAVSYCYLYGQSIDLINNVRAKFPRYNLITSEGSFANNSLLGPKYVILVYLNK